MKIKKIVWQFKNISQRHQFPEQRNVRSNGGANKQYLSYSCERKIYLFNVYGNDDVYFS
jgi:hypothetical protein